MCITFFYISPPKSPHSSIKFLVAFNREENVSRPTQPLDFFAEDRNILAGRDLKAQGTWLGFNKKTQNIAFLTNFFAPELVNSLKAYESRGKLVLSFLRTEFFKEKSANSAEIRDFLRKIQQNRENYAPFHLVLGNIAINSYYYYGNHAVFQEFVKIESGVYSICNFERFFETFSAREEQGVAEIEDLLRKDPSPKEILEKVAEIMQDKPQKKSQNKEKVAVFRNIPFLTTLTSSVLVVDCKKHAIFREISYVYRFPKIARILGLAPWKRVVREIEVECEKSKEIEDF